MTVLSNVNNLGVPDYASPDYRQWCHSVDAQTVRQLVYQACCGFDFERELTDVLRCGLHHNRQDFLADNRFAFGLAQDIYDIVAREIWFGNLIVIAAYLDQPVYCWLVPADELQYTIGGSKQTIPSGVQTGPGRAGQQQKALSTQPNPIISANETHWFQVNIVNYNNGQAVTNVHLDITVPGKTANTTKSQYTDARGRIELLNLAAGTCQIASAVTSLTKTGTRRNTLRYVTEGTSFHAQAGSSGGAIPGGEYSIVEVSDYAVRAGDSLASIAAANGISENELCRFNWSTTDRDKVNRHLYQDMGAPPVEPGEALIFNGEEDQPLLLIAKPWQAKKYSTQQTVNLQVARINPPVRYFSIQLQDEQAQALGGVKYRLIIGVSDTDPELEVFTGSSRDDGLIEHQYHSDTTTGVLQYWPDTHNKVCVLRTIDLGQLAPVDSEVGQAQRLSNLCYAVDAMATDNGPKVSVSKVNTPKLNAPQESQDSNPAETSLALALQTYRNDRAMTPGTGQDVAQHIDSLT